MTVFIKLFTARVSASPVPWKHHSTIPPLVNIANKSNMLLTTIKAHYSFEPMRA